MADKISARWKKLTRINYNEVATVAHNNTSRRFGKKIPELLPQS